MEYIIAGIVLCVVVGLTVGLSVVVAKLSSARAGTREYHKGFSECRMIMGTEIQRLSFANKQLQEYNAMLGEKLQVAARQQLALPANAMTVPEGHIVTFRPIPKDKND